MPKRGGSAISTSVRVEDDLVLHAVRKAKRETRRRVSIGLEKATDRKVLPRVRLLAPSIVRPYLRAKATSRRAYITTRGPRKYDRIAGLLNYGGTVRGPIRPKGKKALTIAPGVVRSRVWTKRVYQGKHFMEAGVQASVGGIEDVMFEEIMEAFGGLPGA